MIRILTCFFLALSCACGGDGDERPFLTLASTTSTQNSGLYEFLLPKFTARTGIDVRVVAVGTGRAVQLARAGDADVLLVHHRGLEEQFVADGFGLARLDVMYNKFHFVGPKSDPLHLRDAKDVHEVMRALAEGKAEFISRGDKSGTHLREVALWKSAGIDPAPASGTWYLEAGGGMGKTLNLAIGKNAYCMTDSSTWLAFKNRGDHEVLFDRDPRIYNNYAVIVVSKQRHPHTKQLMAQQFADWLVSSEGQAAIAAYKIGGQQAFVPNASDRSR